MIEILDSSKMALFPISPSQVTRGTVKRVFENRNRRQIILARSKEAPCKRPTDLVSALLDHSLLEPSMIISLSGNNLNLFQCHSHLVSVTEE